MMSLSSMRCGSVSHLPMVPLRHDNFGWGRHGIPNHKSSPMGERHPSRRDDPMGPNCPWRWKQLQSSGKTNCSPWTFPGPYSGKIEFESVGIAMLAS